MPAHGRGDRPSRRHFYPGSTMTDGQWALPAPLLPAAGSTGGRGGRPEKWDRRLVLDAIFYLVRGGIAWRALPAGFPPHQTVCALFRRWTRARAWCRIYAALRERARLADGRGPVPTAGVIDSQTVRAADTVPTASSGYDGGKKIKGRKHHVAVDTGGLLLAWRGHDRLLVGPRRCVPHHRRAARGVLHDHPGVGRRRVHRPVRPRPPGAADCRTSTGKGADPAAAERRWKRRNGREGRAGWS
ncbi:transposase [Streptomyces sp. NPDC004647]|uniref:transposase n=1 Tax=Streptomyces sp. NPDC004647 TaxID=3154671 RepID=UPI0033A892B4